MLEKYVEKFSFLKKNFQYGCRSYWSTADLAKVVSVRIAGAFNRSGASRAAVFDIPKTIDRIWHAGLLHKLMSYEISDQVFCLI